MSEDDLRSDDSDGDEHEELATLLPSGSRAAKLLGGTTGAKKALSSATGGGGGGALDTGSAEDALRRHFDALQQQRSADLAEVELALQATLQQVHAARAEEEARLAGQLAAAQAAFQSRLLQLEEELRRQVLQAEQDLEQQVARVRSSTQASLASRLQALTAPVLGGGAPNFKGARAQWGTRGDAMRHLPAVADGGARASFKLPQQAGGAGAGMFAFPTVGLHRKVPGVLHLLADSDDDA